MQIFADALLIILVLIYIFLKQEISSRAKVEGLWFDLFLMQKADRKAFFPYCRRSKLP